MANLHVYASKIFALDNRRTTSVGNKGNTKIKADNYFSKQDYFSADITIIDRFPRGVETFPFRIQMIMHQ